MSLERCLSLDRTDYVDVKYYPNGDLFQQIIEAVDYVHEHGVIYPDLAPRQFLLDDDFNVRLGNFYTSQRPGHPAGGIEETFHRLLRVSEKPSAVASDLFATLYELTAGKALYSELFPDESSMHSNFAAWLELRRAWLKIGALYIQQVYADVSCVFGRDITMGCWKEEFSSAEEVLLRFTVLLKEF